MFRDTAEQTEFFRKLETLLLAPKGAISGPQPLTGLKGWDSLAILDFMMLASSDYSREVEPSDIAAAQTVDDLAALVLAGTPAQP